MSNSPSTPPNSSGQSTGGFSPIDFSIVSRKFIIHQITDAELDTIAASSSSLDLTLFGVCAGALVSLLVTVATVTFASAAGFAAYVSVTVISALATLFFGWRGFEAYLAAQRKLAELRRGNPPTLKE
jgi:hypothetical protein